MNAPTPPPRPTPPAPAATPTPAPRSAAPTPASQPAAPAPAAPAPTPAAPPPAPTPAGRLRAATTSEWIKLRSVRSTPATLLATFVVAVGVGALVCANFHGKWTTMSAADRSSFDPTKQSFIALEFANILVGIMGVLVVSNEYASGLIRTTFTTTPQRGLILAAKVITFGLVAWPAATVTCFAAFFTGQGLFSGPVPDATLGQPGVLRAVLGAGVYLLLIGLLGLAVAALVRSTAVAIGTLFSLLLMVPVIVSGLPDGVKFLLAPYLPSEAGHSLYDVRPVAHVFAPGAGLAVLIGYVLVTMTAAFVVVRRRDA